MTLVAAWIREVNGVEELIVASDSRLRFGRAWDYSPKILSLARADSVLCFAGDTFYAYPMLLQLRAALEMNEKISSRAADISEIRSYIISIIEDMRKAVYDLPVGVEEDNDYRFIFAGYSWRHEKFMIWHIQYQNNIGKFSYRSVGIYPKKHNEGRKVLFIGDHYGEARKRLSILLKSKDRKYGELDWEPLEVLRDMSLNETEFPEIGGSPQVIKVYKFMNSMPLNVYWPNKAEGGLYFGGRKLLPFEKNRYFSIDAESLEID